MNFRAPFRTGCSRIRWYVVRIDIKEADWL